MHYGAMTVQDYEQVMALCAGQPGVLIRDADSPEHFARYLQRNPGLSLVARDGEALAGCILCGHDGRRGYLNPPGRRREPSTPGHRAPAGLDRARDPALLLPHRRPAQPLSAAAPGQGAAVRRRGAVRRAEISKGGSRP